MGDHVRNGAVATGDIDLTRASAADRSRTDRRHGSPLSRAAGKRMPDTERTGGPELRFRPAGQRRDIEVPGADVQGVRGSAALSAGVYWARGYEPRRSDAAVRTFGRGTHICAT